MVVLDFQYDKFEMIITSFFPSSNKDFEEIQQIVTSIQIAYLAKQLIKTKADLTIITKKKWSKKNNSRQNRKYFNYGKKSHYAKNCHSSISNKKKLEESTKKAKYA